MGKIKCNLHTCTYWVVDNTCAADPDSNREEYKSILSECNYLKFKSLYRDMGMDLSECQSENEQLQNALNDLEVQDE